MNRTILWVVGEPGAGKTTLVSSLIDNKRTINPKPKWTVGPHTAAAGHYIGGKFDGADTVPYNGVEQALGFWREVLQDKSLTIFDGDRFSNIAVVDKLKGNGHRICCAHLVCHNGEGAARRLARGSEQSEIWVRGRITKSHRFAGQFEDKLELDAAWTREVLVARAKEFLKIDWELLEEDP